MMKKIFKNLSRSFCVYLVTIANVIYAIRNNCIDWLLWVSVALSALSAVLSVVSAIGDRDD